jgi:hypothetical protein
MRNAGKVTPLAKNDGVRDQLLISMPSCHNDGNIFDENRKVTSNRHKNRKQLS